MSLEKPIAGSMAGAEKLIVSLIDLIGSDGFASRLSGFLEQELGFDHFHIFLYRKNLAPAVLANCPDPIGYDRGLQNYLNYTYVVNPAYRAYRRGKRAGVYLISDFLKNDDPPVIDHNRVDVHIENSEAIGYRTPGWPKNMAEVIVLINLPNGTALDFSFLTPLGSRRTEACRRSLERLFPYLNTVLLKQFALNSASLDAEDVASPQEARFNDFGVEVLTSRELEITRLILVGHSSNSISMNLGISLPTVKTHRRNIYNKLQISSQAELFSLFLLHLK